MNRAVLVTGGAGYIGAVLVPKLLRLGYRVSVLDRMVFGDTLVSVRDAPGFELVIGDIRDRGLVDDLLEKGRFGAVIHLAAISNDPSAEVDADLTREVNLVAVEHLMTAAKTHRVPRFLYASSASVYGVKATSDVTEDLSLEPITLYARYKAEGERILNRLVDERFLGVSVRAATVCGYSPRLRLDLTINILTVAAVVRREIQVFGGTQMRPNIHVQDLADFYAQLLSEDPRRVSGQAFNVSHKNATVMELAEMVKGELGEDVRIRVVPTNDPRSYHLSTRKVEGVLGFWAKTPLTEAVRELKAALAEGRLQDPDAPIYRNVELMKRHPELLRFQAAPTSASVSIGDEA